LQSAAVAHAATALAPQSAKTQQRILRKNRLAARRWGSVLLRAILRAAQ